MRRLVLAGFAGALLAGVTVSGNATADDSTVLVFNGEGNRLNVYDPVAEQERTLIPSRADEPDNQPQSRDINAQICFHEHGGETYFIAGEDTGQDDGGGGDPGWGWFRLSGTDLHSLQWEQRGKLVTEYSGDADNPENYGCGFLDGGSLVLSDVGNQRPGNPGSGQLHVWFPDGDEGFGAGYKEIGGIPQPSNVKSCFIDQTLATAGGIWVDQKDPAKTDDDVVYVASARPSESPTDDEWGIFRFTGIGLVKSNCKNVDDLVGKELFIAAGATGFTPSAIAPSGRGTLYVSSVFDGNIAEFSEDGTFQRWVVGGPPVGQVTGFLPVGSGTPFGIGVAPDGTLYYADIGVVGDGPYRPGRVMKVEFDPDGNPGLPTEVDTGLEFPDGIGILTL